MNSVTTIMLSFPFQRILLTQSCQEFNATSWINLSFFLILPKSLNQLHQRIRTDPFSFIPLFPLSQKCSKISMSSTDMKLMKIPLQGRDRDQWSSFIKMRKFGREIIYVTVKPCCWFDDMLVDFDFQYRTYENVRMNLNFKNQS